MPPKTINLQIERLRRIPQRADDTWQATVYRAPMWIQEDGDPAPYRPWLALCVSGRRSTVHMVGPRPAAEPHPGMVLESIVGLATSEHGGYRPGMVEVKDAAVAAELRPLLAGVDIEVEERSDLPANERARRELEAYLREGRPDPAALQVQGVTVEHLRAFADAAGEFHAAAPWRHLMDGDLLEVVSPVPERGLAFAAVMGSSGLQYGLGLYASREMYENIFGPEGVANRPPAGGLWSFSASEPHYVPFSDLDVWEEHKLSLIDGHQYPLLANYGSHGVKRPTPRQWAYVEGLLRAIARTSEGEMDSGRWTKRVETIDGPTEYVLTLPTLSDPCPLRTYGIPDPRLRERVLVDLGRATRDLEFESEDEFSAYLRENFTGQPVSHVPGQTPLERAQDLVYEAVAVRGRRQLHLIRQALEICPDCADAYVLLAEREHEPSRMRALYEQGVAAGERALGPEAFEESSGPFWGVIETRPYMRARFGLAECLAAADRFDEAAAHYQELLRLNPDDNQGARYRLVNCYLRTRQLAELEELLARYDSPMAQWAYAGALAAYMREGDSPTARARLAAAQKANRRVRKYLLRDAELPAVSPTSFQPGAEDEAAVVAGETLDIWESTPGAIEWLAAQTKLSKPKRRRRRK